MNLIENKRYLPKNTKLYNRYIILEIIGEGGFGITYRAFDTLINSYVAIKELFVDGLMDRDVDVSLNVSVMSDDTSLSRIEACKDIFRREIEIMEKVKNIPYISRIRNSFSENNTDYIVMKLLEGKTLSKIFHEGHDKPIPADRIMRPLENTLIAIEKMHRLGIIHRDISPGNLFLTENGDLYLIDFGSGVMLTKDGDRPSVIFEHKGFEPPECGDLSKQGAWTDIYSLCATLVYLLTGNGVPGVDDRRKFDIVPQILTGVSLGNKQQNALIHGLALDIDRRWQSVEALRGQLFGEAAEKLCFANVKYSACTGIGGRAVNQDNLMVDGDIIYEGTDFCVSGTITSQKHQLHMVAVCDGVSGASSGELASRAVAQGCRHFINQYRDSELLPEVLVEEFADQINEKIISLGKKIGATASTLSLLLWKDNQFLAANIGDSPIILIRKRKIREISTAHTLDKVKKLEGRLISIQDRHTLINYLGRENVAGSQIMSIRHGYLQRGDCFVLCTDGVTNKIDYDRLKRICTGSEVKAGEKIDKILKKNANNDNYTSVILKF